MTRFDEELRDLMAATRRQSYLENRPHRKIPINKLDAMRRQQQSLVERMTADFALKFRPAD